MRSRYVRSRLPCVARAAENKHVRAPQLRPPGLTRPSSPRQPAGQRATELLGELFPEPAEAPARVTGARRWAAFLLTQVAALAAGTALMLVRFSGPPPWHGLYAEDLGIYLPQALAHPWQLLQSYGGYLQLGPRLIAQFVSLLPLRDAATGFAIAGALVASGCALFCYHACTGQVSSRWLRAGVGLSVVLLPVAQLEIADNGVNTPWYLLVALFWALLWRPRTRGGAWTAAVVGFLAAASSSLALVFAPLVAVRAIVVPWRAREHAVTAGWAAGSLLQVGVIMTSHLSRSGALAKAPLYYSRDVVLPALGWHLSWHLRSAVGVTGAILVVACFLALVLGLAVLTQETRCRVFVVTAVATGLVFTLVSTVLGWGAPDKPATPFAESGSRYSTLPILLLDAALIVTADACARRWRPRPQAIAAVAALTALLAIGWIWDFRYTVGRANLPAWSQTAESWQHYCQQSPAGSITVSFPDYWGPAPLTTTLRCASLRR
jgi:hypothetical protein